MPGSPNVSLYLSPFICLPAFLVVSRLFGCLSSFVSQFIVFSLSGCWCPALFMSVFNCLPSFVSQSGWWCPALRMSLFAALPSCVSKSGRCPALWMSVFACLFYLSPRLAGGVRLFGCLSLICFTCFPSLGFLSGWWCPALWMCLFTCLPSFASHAV